MSRVWLALFVATMVAAAAGCDDGPPGDDPDCSAYDDLCDAEGALECAGRTIEQCLLQPNGCLRWRDHDQCGPHQRCDDGAAEAICLCENDCEVLGAQECDGDVVVECRRDADGCLYSEGQINCGGTGQTCVEDGPDGPACAGCPGDRCDARGDVRCRRQVIQRCELQEDGCLDWVDDEDCAASDPPGFCREDGGAATCVDECADNCEPAGGRRCSGDVIETCAVQDYGCLDWEEGEDCSESADYCDDASGDASCLSCEHGCPAAGDMRCAGSVVETCEEDLHGCRSWVAGTDCATLDPTHLCEQDGATATCTELPATGACENPIVVTEPHALYSGTDFTADFENDQHLGGRGCRSDDPTMDAVFAIDLAAGQTLRVRETGDLDAVLSLQIVCGDSSDCVFSEDTGEETGHDYRAIADGRVYVIVETYEPAPRSLDYEIHIDIVETEVCTGGVDEDADGTADCDDPECFGVAPCDAAEANCADGADNDGDGATDCDDTDCDAAPVCGPYLGVYEIFTIDDTIDLAGRSVTFTPDGAAPNGYVTSVDDASDFPTAPGSGVLGEELALDDDDVATYLFTLLLSVSFYGETHSSMYVSSNGYVSFVDWSLSWRLDIDDFFAFPAVAGLLTDLTPALPSTDGDAVVTVDEFVDRIVVTFQDVPIWYDEFFGFVEGPNDFQMSIAEDGTVVLTWLEINAFEGIAGVGNGVGTGDYPAPTDLVP